MLKNKTTVVNFFRDEFDVYIGRPGKGQSGYFGNPCKRNEKCYVCGKVHTDAGSTIACFKVYFYKRMKEDKEFKKRVKEELKGKRLACFCKTPKEPNKPCHGDIYVEYLEGESK